MPRVLDLNAVQCSFMDLTLRDPAGTMVQLDMATEELVNELENMGAELDKLKSGDHSGVNLIYDLAARLINCNLDCFHVTGEELRKKYRMNVLSAIQFFSAYLDAINELANQKN